MSARSACTCSYRVWVAVVEASTTLTPPPRCRLACLHFLRYCAGGEATPTGACAQGHYCRVGTTAPDEFPCPAGTYTTRTNASSTGDCDRCPVGHYCVQGAIEPAPCLPGSFSNQTNTAAPGPGSWPECQTCPGGYQCTIGSPEPVPCGVGAYSRPGEADCKPCLAGHYCVLEATSYMAMGLK